MLVRILVLGVVVAACVCFFLAVLYARCRQARRDFDAMYDRYVSAEERVKGSPEPKPTVNNGACVAAHRAATAELAAREACLVALRARMEEVAVLQEECARRAEKYGVACTPLTFPAGLSCPERHAALKDLVETWRREADACDPLTVAAPYLAYQQYAALVRSIPARALPFSDPPPRGDTCAERSQHNARLVKQWSEALDAAQSCKKYLGSCAERLTPKHEVLDRSRTCAEQLWQCEGNFPVHPA